MHLVSGDDPRAVHEEFARTLDACYERIREIQSAARSGRKRRGAPRWPAIVLRTPKGWTGPKFVDGLPVEGTFRAHQVPLDNVRSNPAHLAQLEEWMQSYRPEELFDDGRRARRRGDVAGAERRPAHGRQPRTPTAAGCSARCSSPNSPSTRCRSTTRRHRRRVDPPARRAGFATSTATTPTTSASSAPTRPTATGWAPCSTIENRCFEEAIIPIDDHVSAGGRVMEVLSEHYCEGWLEGYLLTGRHGLFATYEAFAMVVRVDDRPAREVAGGGARTALACTGRRR